MAANEPKAAADRITSKAMRKELSARPDLSPSDKGKAKGKAKGKEPSNLRTKAEQSAKSKPTGTTEPGDQAKARATRSIIICIWMN